MAIATIGVKEPVEVLDDASNKKELITTPTDEDKQKEAKEEKEKLPSCLKRRDSYFDEPLGRC